MLFREGHLSPAGTRSRFLDGTRSTVILRAVPPPEGSSFWNPDFPKGKILPLRGCSAIAFARDDSVRSLPSGDGRSGVILRSGFDEGSGLDSEGLKTQVLRIRSDNQPLRCHRGDEDTKALKTVNSGPSRDGRTSFGRQPTREWCHSEERFGDDSVKTQANSGTSHLVILRSGFCDEESGPALLYRQRMLEH